MHRGILWLLSIAIAPVTANTLFQNATIISFDEDTNDFRVLREASLLVEGDRISRLIEGGIASQLATNNVTIIDARDKIISPGFVDTHHHVWQTLFKTLGANVDIGTYYQQFGAVGSAGLDGGFTPEDTFVSQLAGNLEMISEGTTTVIDYAHGCFSQDHTNEAVRATFESGIRSFFALAVQRLPNGYPIAEQTQMLQDLAEDPRFAESNHRVSMGLAYDLFNTASAENTSVLWDIVTQNNLSVVTTYYMGGPYSSQPNSPVALNELGWLNSSVPVIFAHANFIDDENANVLRSTNQYFSATPEAEFQLGLGNRHSHLILDQGSLGIDLHFTFSSGMVSQARLWLQSLRDRAFVDVLDTGNVPRFNPMSVKQAFSLITRHGGLALRRPDIGVIQEGAKADLLVFSTDSPTMLGWNDPIAAIIMHSNPGDIEHVMIDGHFVKLDYSLTFDDYPGFRQQFQAAAHRVQDEWITREWEPLGDTYSSGTPYMNVESVDTSRGNGTGF